MIKLFNNRLFNQYYPITETTKQRFLDSNYWEIYETATNINQALSSKYYAEQNKYLSHMKSKNSSDVSQDENRKIFYETTSEFYTLRDRLSHYEYDRIRIDELNYVLIFMNMQTHKVWLLRIVLLFVILIVITILDRMGVRELLWH